MTKHVNFKARSLISKIRLSWTVLFDKIFNVNRILVIGDSHAEIFTKPFFNNFSRNSRLYVCAVGGATLSGLSNPNSQTQASPIFKKAYNYVKPKNVIFLLGEVDTGFLLWLLHDKTGREIDDLLDKAISNYKNLIINMQGSSSTVIISTPLPTIKDNQTWGDIANARKNVNASQMERTNLTLLFNYKIKIWSLTQGLKYLDLDDISLGEDGLVSPELLNSNPNDHHYCDQAYASLVIQRLKSYLV